MQYCASRCAATTAIKYPPPDTSIVRGMLKLQGGHPVSFPARSISEEFSSGDARYRDNGEPGPGSTHGRDPRSPKEKEDKERGDEGISICFMWLYLRVRPVLPIPFVSAEMIKVYDGNNSLRRRIFRVITVPRQATTEQVLTSALRAFHITKDPSTYEMCDLKSLLKSSFEIFI